MTPTTVNCPFYGRALYQQNGIDRPGPFLLMNTHGNQCALVRDAHSPCMLETVQHPIDWRTCGRVDELRVG